ncbi:MAG: HemK/PrmC family methyltransferase [Candidatus Paceibacterota bacterium]|jgi:release factor glutamine methyltransferase|nr:peptide chain release factor N(5)-glutamine methyltransferase [Candidatus Paceibacterota bacterium]MDD4467259.1 peptide chain release factor N(5)-glutamine methyltransferase [Candidatus Paceibacterota bacterium]
MDRKEINWLIEEKYKKGITKDFEKDICRLKNGEPIDYIIGFVYFLKAKIDLSYKPLIPRPETEFWAEKAVKETGKKEVLCLDLFSGSGCVGVAVLKNNKNAKVDFGEIDKNLLKQIKLNLNINKIKRERYNVFYSDIFSKIKKKYDYIFANPPYIPEKRKNKVQKSVILFEKKEALFGKEDGLFYIRIFLKEVRKHLKKGGRAYLEFDSSQKKEIEKIEKEADFYRDQYGKWRFLIISKK